MAKIKLIFLAGVIIFSFFIIVPGITKAADENCCYRAGAVWYSCMLLEVPAGDCHKYYYFFSGSGPADAHQCQENNLEKCPGNTLSIGKNCANITPAEIQNDPANCLKYRLYSSNTEGRSYRCKANPNYPEPDDNPCVRGDLCAVSPCYYEPLARCETQDPSITNDFEIKKVNLAMDPDYIKATKKDRLFDPSEQFTPFDDVICEAAIGFKSDSQCSDPPNESSYPDSLEGRLLTVKDGQEVEVATGFLVKKLNEQGKIIKGAYQWKIAGWSSGWTQDEEVMEAMVKSKKIKCEVKYKNDTKNKQKDLTLCVHLWGPGGASFRMINMRGESGAVSPQWIVGKGISNYANGFHAIKPFSEVGNKEEFGHYSDLKEYQDTGANFTSIKKLKFPNSECGDGYKVFYHNNPGRDGYTDFSVRNILLKISEGPRSVVHEMGHSFCLLWDEYISPRYTVAGHKGVKRLNCRNSDFWEQKYGDKIAGCTFDKAVTGVEYYRPSPSSIMKTLASNFNVIGYGYCAKRIHGGILSPSVRSYWEKALGLQGVEQPAGIWEQ